MILTSSNFSRIGKTWYKVLLLIFVSFAVFLWFVYGILISNPPVIIANFLVFVQAFAILIFKVKYK